MEILNPFSLLKKLLFIYQQEVYVTPKLLAFAYSSRVFEQAEKRQELDWTLKVKLFYFATLGLFFLTLISSALVYWWVSSVLFFLIKTALTYTVLVALLPLYLVAVNVFFIPLDIFLKQRRIARTRDLIQRHKSHMKVIGITGSYGKTSVKELLTAVLSEKYSVITTKENKNTPLGIAEMVSEISVSHQIFIVEMGAYVRGDIQELCDLVDPDYGVLTGINEQHLERQGSVENIIKTKNELSSSVPASGKLWVNGNNELSKTTPNDYAKCDVIVYDDSGIKNIEYSDLGQQKITYDEQVVESSILADYFPSLVDLAFKIGREFGLSDVQIKKALEKMQPAEHRLEPKYFKETDVLIIDDAFNGNPDGALAAMKTLKRFDSRRRIYLTPGLVELGDKTAEIHQWLGKNLAFHTDEVWLIKKSVTDDIVAGLKKSKFDESKIRIFDTDTEAHKACRTQLNAGDVLLIQNDWTDNYM